MFQEYTPWRPSTKRLSSTGLDQSAGGAQRARLLESPVERHTLGARRREDARRCCCRRTRSECSSRSAEYELQSGTGAAGPTHAIVRVDVGNPVCATAFGDQVRRADVLIDAGDGVNHRERRPRRAGSVGDRRRGAVGPLDADARTEVDAVRHDVVANAERVAHAPG